jgi:hypothetical protein
MPHFRNAFRAVTLETNMQCQFSLGGHIQNDLLRAANIANH